MQGGALIVLGLGAIVAFANGANDVSKGIATLVGSGLASERRALAWGAFWTGAGGLLGAVFAGAMVSTFGTGVFGTGAHPSLAMAAGVVGGTAAWVLLATRFGLPVSTTHALLGALLGVGVIGLGAGDERWSAVGVKFVLPLALSPVAALATTAAVVRAGRRWGGRAWGANDCVCIDVASAALEAAGVGALSASRLPVLRITSGTAEACATTHTTKARLTLDRVHWMTSAGISAARAMNDAPKIAAVILAAGAADARGAVSTGGTFVIVTAAMVCGSLLGGRRVTAVLARKLTRMDRWEGFAANAATAVLVATGAVLGWPMSTTHVSAGGIVGSAADRFAEAVDRRVLGDMLLAWVVTLPGAALLGGVAYLALRVAIR